MREFNLEEAKAGKPVCTRNGGSARIICFDAKCENYPIVALIEKENGGECMASYCINGRFHSQDEDELDLFMKTKKREGWGWLNKCAQVYNTEEEALSHRPDYGIKVFLAKVEWEE